MLWPASTAVVVLIAAVAVVGCGSTESAGPASLRAVATTTQIADMARNVGGDRVAVTSLLDPNVDPHDYEPTPSDVTAVARADVVLENGIGLDGWLDGVIANAGGHARRVRTTEGIALLAGDHEEPQGDPHVWLDPRNAIVMVGNIAKAFTAADPAGAVTYEANAAAYVARIKALDRRLAAEISAVQPSERKIVTDHDAFGYLARRYGITVVGTVIPSLSAAAQPSAGELADLARTVRRERVRTIFSEASVDPRLARAIAAETGATVGRPLAGDSLGPPDGPTGTYLGMIRSDMDAIVAGIRG